MRTLIVLLLSLGSLHASAGGVQTKPIQLQFESQFLTAHLAILERAGDTTTEDQVILVRTARAVAQTDQSLLIQVNEESNLFEVSSEELQKSDAFIELLEKTAN